MNKDLKAFMSQWLGVVAGTALIVVIVAFFSMPLALGFHPGEASDRPNVDFMHMS